MPPDAVGSNHAFLEKRAPTDIACLFQRHGSGLDPAHRPNVVRDRPAHGPAAGALHAETVHQRTTIPARAVERADVDAIPVPAADSADNLQAEYFIHLLAQRRRAIHDRIIEYQDAIATAESRGDVEAAFVFRRTLRLLEHDWQTLDGMIDRLRRRFSRCRTVSGQQQ
ncbi:hypothetical protein [Mycobacterium sherrisii]|uniref:Uncharacterized protein n=1 Tax=Mycobacterium sherrisii TaxID=243061 RepID=A0A1E3SB25_9MYCO|nr:hypothetical protein [Mycobacterium sherrisii]MCV7029292.1 hypothetical protein [Mycobacterium sherrisii]ODQ99360.1 hypothetical protein BHQ21_25315 [Mycobacterium sherrisii]ORW81829.1 hypothetical protein AWC25_02995 [Mycobacterium sherrisii]